MHKRQCQGPFQTTCALVLASSSPRRQRLLSGLGLDFVVRPSESQETDPRPGESPLEYAELNSRLKAMDVARRYPQAVSMGADTIVVLDGEIFGKPRDENHALDMLSRLAGRSHEVITSCCIVWPEKQITVEFSASSFVWLAEQDPDVLRAYVATGEPMDKAGSYAVQGIGSFMVERIEGSYSNVVGLPVDKVIKYLMELEVLKLRDRVV
ncbi:MAG: septum formation protein Maf [Deltaproteobacteria bacterium]|nr:septum formation protein Maf [Deltaproteobacteria bacterium]MBW1718778.1 septum formation protein Maf [Deltaproteobacteria bacterium]MBW1932517.1 septum formation protein Maf [Deltaproteobacteria bacterium]MBW1937881.1 septum formation protein Maf [Deltaproteobacteria bacterium]MBW1963882.1 septum formation protein Maf [Deltaproteobacteria bacterium]